MLEQVHIDKQKHMVANAVSAVDIDIKRGEVPDLNNGESTEHVCKEIALGDKAVLNMVQKRIIPPDDINKY